MTILIGNYALTEKDCDNIRAFKLRFILDVPRRAFNHMRESFSHKMDIDSEWVILHHMARLTGVQPVWYDCCINSCIAYLGKYLDDTKCSFCEHLRKQPTGRAFRQFCYLPIIPRLQGFFRSERKIKEMNYRAKFEKSEDMINDVFDCEHYERLCKTKVVIDGIEKSHKYFSDPRDIALSICTDGFLLFN
ncbi:uncharacterized protein B0H18DRAFT_891936, partial [Fomitopsis serialis]|uniref:uncharacterized protein n=1 Tax=Fomitopsis serialis TaxID=139415 RepID=UPI002008A9A1